MATYLIRELRVRRLRSSKEQNWAERGHILQQRDEGAPHGVANCVPPLGDMRHVHHTGRAPAGLAENLKKTHNNPVDQRIFPSELTTNGKASENSPQSASHLSAGLLRRLGADGVQSGQVQAVHWQLVQVVQQGRGQMGALSGAGGPCQQQSGAIRRGLLKGRAGSREVSG